jgi:titin
VFCFVGTKPLPPSALYLTYLGASSAVIEWEKPYSHGGAPLTHYILEKRESGKTDWELLTNLPPDIMECELDNMSSEKLYYVRVRAANRHGASDPRDLDQPIRVKGEKRGMQLPL